MAASRNKRSRSTMTGISGEMDLMDRKILSALRTDGRLTTSELGAKVGLSPSPCWTRVKKLEASGAIESYVALLNHAAFGLFNTVFVEVTLDKHNDTVLAEFGEALLRIPEVVEAHLATGDYDYLIKVAVSDTLHFERFLRERLYKLPGIRNTRSTFALRALKRSTSVDPLLLV